MNDYARRRMERRNYSRRDSRRDYRGDYRRDYRGDYANDYRNDYYGGEYEGTMEYRGDYADYAETDGRRGVKGTGRYGIGGSRYYPRDRAYEPMDDYRDYEMDYAEHARLGKKDMAEWKRSFKNADGTMGEHFTMETIMPMVEKMGIRFDSYSEKEFCLAMNMMYSDYCKVARKFGADRPEFYAEMAKAFLEDEDAPEGSEKIALYYHCIVKEDE